VVCFQGLFRVPLIIAETVKEGEIKSSRETIGPIEPIESTDAFSTRCLFLSITSTAVITLRVVLL
jgi:hypothetical protein